MEGKGAKAIFEIIKQLKRNEEWQENKDPGDHPNVSSWARTVSWESQLADIRVCCTDWTVLAGVFKLDQFFNTR